MKIRTIALPFFGTVALTPPVKGLAGCPSVTLSGVTFGTFSVPLLGMVFWRVGWNGRRSCPAPLEPIDLAALRQVLKQVGA